MGPRAPAPKDGCIARRWSNDHRAAGARVAIEAQTRIALAARRENEGARRRPLPLEQPFFGEKWREHHFSRNVDLSDMWSHLAPAAVGEGFRFYTSTYLFTAA